MVNTGLARISGRSSIVGDMASALLSGQPGPELRQQELDMRSEAYGY